MDRVLNGANIVSVACEQQSTEIKEIAANVENISQLSISSSEQIGETVNESKKLEEVSKSIRELLTHFKVS